MALPKYKLFDANVLGSASPYNWLITINGPLSNNVRHMPKSLKVTLAHEFGHLLHYFTTYLGLSDLLFWARSLRVLRQDRPAEISPEAHVTEQSRQLIRIARQKQILSIDDFYYYEPMRRLHETATNQPNRWKWSESTGGLFNTRGELSDHRFWCLRFSLLQDNGEAPFLRIPVGMRTILEHMATAIDIIGERATRSKAEFERYLNSTVRSAYVPDMLHYYALTHRFSSTMSKLYGDGHLPWRFVACAHIVLLLADIPFDDTLTWRSLRIFAENVDPPLASHMSYPHPSFVFPLLLRALELSQLSLDKLTEPAKFEFNANTMLAAMGLPSLDSILAVRQSRAREVAAELDEADPSKTWSKLVSWMAEHEAGLSRAEKLTSPLKGLRERLPVPVYFETSNLTWEGEIIPFAQSEILADMYDRSEEMIRYPIARDIVE